MPNQWQKRGEKEELTLLGVLKNGLAAATNGSDLALVSIGLLALPSTSAPFSSMVGAVADLTISMIGSKAIEEEWPTEALALTDDPIISSSRS